MPRKDRSAYNAYMRVYMLRRYRERRDRALKMLGEKCSRCQSTTNLQFDHTDHTKKSIRIDHLFTTASWKRILPELKKCQILCAQCHAQKTLEDLDRVSARTTHGTISSARYCKPICNLCREAKNDHHKKYMRKKRDEMREQKQGDGKPSATVR